MGIKSNNLAAIYHDFFSRSGTDASFDYVPPGLFVEDVFSTYLYTGNGSTQTITNGIDLSGEGGMVFLGHRNSTSIGDLDRAIHDSERGAQYAMYPSSVTYSAQNTNSLSSFNSDGFSLATGNARYNDNGYDYSSWTFRKAPGFFDVVTYTGTGSVQSVPHSLGSAPGVIICKRTDDDSDWWVFHHTNDAGYDRALKLNGTDSNGGGIWGNTLPTSTHFTLSGVNLHNQLDAQYIAYLFAHDEQIFGENKDQSIIKCGSYVGNGATGQEIDLGWEPQWALIKCAGTLASWNTFDNMRGWIGGVGGTLDSQRMYVDTAGTENNANGQYITPRGFYLNQNYTGINRSGEKYIYIAIRRGPMKTPTDATKVFSVNTSNGSAGTNITTGFPVDMQITSERDNGFLSGMGVVHDRLRGISSTDTEYRRMLRTHLPDGEFTAGGTATRDWDNTGFDMPAYPATLNTVFWNFRRAPGFFDVATYRGNGGTSQNVNHNLGVVPELIFVKNKSASADWRVYVGILGNTGGLVLNADSANNVGSTELWNSTSPTSSVFTVGSFAGVNGSTNDFIAYLFASRPGVSKVGSYTGSTNVARDIDCGFAGGARFVLIKRTDTQLTGTSNDTDWYVWDTARGIVSGNDPYLRLNTTDTENTSTDYIDSYSTGFTVTSTAPASLNTTGGTYIFLAIA